MKIAIIGFSGSGKSTLAKQLSKFYKIPTLHLDTVFFKEGWNMRDEDETLERVSSFMKHKNWIIKGNYTGLLQEQRRNDADWIVFLNFNRFTCLYRALKRYLHYRGTTRGDVAEGCEEKIDLEFIGWLLYAGRNKAHKNQYQKIIETHKKKIEVCKNQKQLDTYINKLYNNT